jgi:hypothetical protein
LTGSTLSTNYAAYSFGGGFSNVGGTVTVTGSTLYANSANNGGGGIYNSFGALTMSGSTLSANHTLYGVGGGIYNTSDTLTLIGSTLSGNSAPSGGGIDNSSGGPLSLQNTIIAGNQAPSGGPDVRGQVAGTSSYNLVGNGAGLFGISDGFGHNQVGTPASPIDPLLAPLGNYGGPTRTFALLPGSPALDAGDPALAGTPDQRGLPRSGGVNIGAFQASASAFVVSAPDTATAGVAFDVRVTVVDLFGQAAVGYTGTTQIHRPDQ